VEIEIFRGLGNMSGSTLADLGNVVLRKRTFDSLQLLRWIQENSLLIINGRTLQQWCTLLCEPYIFLFIWMLVYGVIIPPSIIWLAKVKKQQDDLDGYQMFGVVCLIFLGYFLVQGVVGILGTNCEAISKYHRARYDFLRKLDGNMKKTPMRLIVTSHGGLGLGHRHVKTNDEVYFVQGCSKPVILRPYKDGYRVIGRVYMYPQPPRPYSISADSWKRFKLH
jgi:hypothetical protein